MDTITAFVRRHPLVAFFVLAYALTWPLIPLVTVSPLWGFPALFGPALAAVIVAAITDGRAGLKDLLSRLVRWRVGARWYAVALGLPMLLAITAAGLHLVLGAPTFVTFGELWGAWHLPTFFVPGAPQYGLPFSAFVLLTMAYSVVIGWVYVHARGSVLIASLMHGAINLSQGFFLGGVDPASEYWLLAAVYGVAALGVALAFGANLSRKRYVEADRPRVQDKASSG
jgi:hypothetical protein